MNKNLKPYQSNKFTPASVTSFHGDISRQVGNIRAVTLGDIVMNTNRAPYAAEEIQESIEETFGK